MAERELLVRIVGDDRDLQRALTNTERSVGRIDNRTAAFGKNIRGAFAAAGVTVGAGAILTGINTVTQAASDLNEQISRTEVILGDSADAMVDWSETTASSMGISQRAALAAAATFAGLFQTVGVQQRQAGELSRVLVQLAADLASLSNTSPEEALLALRSGLAGEAEPLRRYNIFLSEAVVQQRAMADTGKENAKQLTLQEKTLARYNLILQQSAPAQGNFALTAGELANQQRIARAELDDLSTTVGQFFIPAMESAVGVAGLFAASLNDLIGDIGGLKQALSETDAFDGWNEAVENATENTVGFFERIRDGIPLMDEFMRVRERVISRADSGAPTALAALGPGAGIGADIARRAAEDAKRAAGDIAEADRQQRRGGRAFDAFVKGIGLKIDKAQLTAGLADDIAALNEFERAIQRRIQAEGRTFVLVDQLTQVRLQRQSLVERQAADVKAASERAAAASKRAADAAKAAIEEEREQERELARLLIERKRERQFTELGLTAEGDKRTPGAGALEARRQNLLEQVKGTVLDTEKTRSQLARIAEVLSGAFGKVGKDVRDAILQMFNDIASALDEGGKKGPLTKTSGLNTRQILEGMGLSPEEIRELRGRLSSINTGGRQLAGATRTTGALAGGFVGGAPVIVESHTTINLDGQKVANVVTRNQQKGRRRNPQQKRGPNRRGI